MDKRHQVFVSSPFEDLREERNAVISAILEMDCFPAGMELFPAADEDSMTLIKKVIDDSDYYLLVLGGRYGSVPLNGSKSFTHLEYDHALSVGKPTIALLHSDPLRLPGGKSERSDEGRRRLDDFRAELKDRHYCRLWADQSELKSAVFTSILHLKKTRPAVGWIRGSELPSENLKDELIRLRGLIDSLNNELNVTRSLISPQDADQFAQGSDLTEIWIESAEGPGEFSLTLRWDDIVRAVLPQTIGGGATERSVASALGSLLKEKARQTRIPGAAEFQFRGAVIPRSTWGKVASQMIALGLFEGRADFGAETLWVATPYGIKTGCGMVAEKRSGL